MKDENTPSGELREVDVKFVSLVSKAANKRQFKIFKSADQPEPEKLEQEETKQAVSFMKMMKDFFTGGNERQDVTKADTIVPDFATTLKVEQINMWKLWDAIGDVFWNLVRNDVADKRMIMEKSLDQLKAEVLKNFDTLTAITVVKGTVPIEKTGAKISAARLANITAARDYLTGVITDAAPATAAAEGLIDNDQAAIDAASGKNAIDDLEIELDGEVQTIMKQEELQALISKAVGEAVAPLQTKLDAIEKGEKPTDAPAELTAENVSEIVKSAVEGAIKPVSDRVAKMETARGMSNQDPGDGEQQRLDLQKSESPWGGLFSK